MIYTTTKCPHCGYRTRNREVLASKMQLDQTLACCPMCGNPIIDPINIEYEFMTKKEQKKWTTKSLALGDNIRGVIALILGIILFIVGITNNDKNSSGILFALIFGGGFIFMSIRRFITVQKAKELNIGEQTIYESLLRTSNKKYVNLLIKAYSGKRTYHPLENRYELIEKYKYFSTREIHEKYKANFIKLLKLIEDENKKDIEVKESISSESMVKGGALVAGAMAIPSTIIEIKQNKELAKKENKTNQNSKEPKKNNQITKENLNNEKKDTKMEYKNNSIDKQEKTNLTQNNNKKKLKELKELYEDDLINEEEYKKIRENIINKYYQ